MPDEKATANLKERETKFNEGLNKLMQDCEMGLQARAIITPDGRVGAILSLIDDSKKAQAERQKQMEGSQGLATAE